MNNPSYTGPAIQNDMHPHAHSIMYYDFSPTRWWRAYREARERARVERDEAFKKQEAETMELTEAFLSQPIPADHIMEDEYLKHVEILQEFRDKGRSLDIQIMTEMTKDAFVVIVVDDTTLIDDQVWEDMEEYFSLLAIVSAQCNGKNGPGIQIYFQRSKCTSGFSHTSIQIKLAFKARANYIKDKPPTPIYQIFKELSAKEIVQECTAVAMGWQANYTKSLKYFEVKPCKLEQSGSGWTFGEKLILTLPEDYSHRRADSVRIETFFCDPEGPTSSQFIEDLRPEISGRKVSNEVRETVEHFQRSLKGVRLAATGGI